jgi:hypothetical protein
LTIARQRVSKRVGFLVLVSNLPQSQMPGCVGSTLIQLMRLSTLPVDIQVSCLQSEAEVLPRLAGEPLNFPRDGCSIFLHVGQFEEALVDSRTVNSKRPHFRRYLVGFRKAIQADVASNSRR